MFKNDYIATKERNIRELYTQMSGFSNTDIIRKSLMTNGEKVKHSSMFLLACKVYFIFVLILKLYSLNFSESSVIGRIKLHNTCKSI